MEAESVVKSLWDEKYDVKVTKDLTVTLRLIGTADDPFRFTRLQSEWSRKVEQFHQAARLELMEIHKSTGEAIAAIFPGDASATFSACVAYWASSKDSYIDALSLRAKQLVTEGVVDGERKYHDIGKCGESAIKRVMTAIVRFNQADLSLGEV